MSSIAARTYNWQTEDVESTTVICASELASEFPISIWIRTDAILTAACSVR